MSHVHHQSKRWSLVAFLGAMLIFAAGFGASQLVTHTSVASKVIHTFTADAAVSCPAHPKYAKWGQPVRGITLSALQDFIVNGSVVSMMERQERAIRNHWKGNNVRLQILQDRLVGHDGTLWNKHYWYFVRQVIDYGVGIGLNVTINPQTETSMGYADNEPSMTHATQMFWFHMMNYFTNNPRVIFDLFNEPRLVDWNTWLNGGYVNGWSDHFIGTKQLIAYIRNEGANNQIWVEGINWASTLAGVPILPFRNIVYTFHHPGSPHPDKDVIPGPALWDPSFGCLAAQGYKVLDAEFANYVGNYYWDKHPGKYVRVYLHYLQMHHVGLACWTLTAGSLNANGDFMSESSEPQGDGKIVSWYFHRQSHAQHVQVLAARKG